RVRFLHDRRVGVEGSFGSVRVGPAIRGRRWIAVGIVARVRRLSGAHRVTSFHSGMRGIWHASCTLAKVATRATIVTSDTEVTKDPVCGQDSESPLRYSSIRVLPKVLGFTCSRSRNSATPSSYEASSSA